MKIFFLVAAILWSFTVVPAQAQWVDKNGVQAADAPERKTVDGFGGWLMVTPDADWKEKWSTPRESTPVFSPAEKMSIGDRVTVLSFFSNPALNAEGKTDVVMHITITLPDGEVAVDQGGVCHAAALNPQRLRDIYLCAQVVQIGFDPTDAPGPWVVKVVVRDNVSKRSVALTRGFTLLPAP